MKISKIIPTTITALALGACSISVSDTPGYDYDDSSYVSRVKAKNAGDMVLPFSESVRVDNTVYLSGAIGAKPGESTLVSGGIAAETRQTLLNLEAAAKRHGLDRDDFVKCTVFLDDISDWPAMNAVYVTFFEDGRFPARSALGADGLALGAAVEIECIAVDID